jgi:hypothetical protein
MNPNDPKPLDPETLTCIREGVEWRRGLTLDDKDIAIAELLADRDWQEAQRREAEESRDFLARLSGSAIVRATALGPGEKVIEFDETIAGHALTGAVERLRARAEQAEREPYERGMLDTRRAYAKVWADATRTEIGALDFTADRLRAELRSRWLERRSLADGTVPAVGQRVVTIREVAEQWGLLHGHDGHVHEITSLLGGHSHLVECGPQQIGVAMLRLAPAGSDVTCPACRGWTVESDRRRIDAQVFRETQFKVAELGRSLADAERERDEAREKTIRDFFVWLVGREAWDRPMALPTPEVLGRWIAAWTRGGPASVRGTASHPCEGCGNTTKGSTLDNGWHRCNSCGYPSK